MMAVHLSTGAAAILLMSLYVPAVVSQIYAGTGYGTGSGSKRYFPMNFKVPTYGKGPYITGDSGPQRDAHPPQARDTHTADNAYSASGSSGGSQKSGSAPGSFNAPTTTAATTATTPPPTSSSSTRTKTAAPVEQGASAPEATRSPTPSSSSSSSSSFSDDKNRPRKSNGGRYDFMARLFGQPRARSRSSGRANQPASVDSYSRKSSYDRQSDPSSPATAAASAAAPTRTPQRQQQGEAGSDYNSNYNNNGGRGSAAAAGEGRTSGQSGTSPYNKPGPNEGYYNNNNNNYRPYYLPRRYPYFYGSAHFAFSKMVPITATPPYEYSRRNAYAPTYYNSYNFYYHRRPVPHRRK